MKFRKVFNLASKLINVLIPTHQNRYYFRYLENAPGDYYDVLNYGSSNMFSIINYVANHWNGEKLELIVEYYDNNRLDDYKKFSEMALKRNVFIRFIEGPKYKNEGINFFLEVKNSILRFSSKYWINESGGTTFFGKLKSQRIICTNYFISCKNDYIPEKRNRWGFIDELLTTALLPSQIISCSVGVALDKCMITGFPRNDTILNSKKKEYVYEWLKSIISFNPEKIIVFAPTYRDYERNVSGHRPLFGYDTHDLQAFLEKTESIIIYKLHPYHTIDIDSVPKNIIPYYSNYNFSLYDVMSVADSVICDYSSVAYDFLLADKPIIYNLYDLEQYEATRGLSYEPYDLFCAGEIVKNEEELIGALEHVVYGKDLYRERRREMTKIFHKYTDSDSVQRAYEIVFADLLKEQRNG